jgi:hypothetical protein
MEEIKLEIGKHYKTKDGRIIFIKDGLPPINNQKDGWNGIYFGEFVDGSDKIIQRFLWNGKHWDYISQFSSFGYRDLNTPSKDLVEEVQM